MIKSKVDWRSEVDQQFRDNIVKKFMIAIHPPISNAEISDEKFKKVRNFAEKVISLT